MEDGLERIFQPDQFGRLNPDASRERVALLRAVADEIAEQIARVVHKDELEKKLGKTGLVQGPVIPEYGDVCRLKTGIDHYDALSDREFILLDPDDDRSLHLPGLIEGWVYVAYLERDWRVFRIPLSYIESVHQENSEKVEIEDVDFSGQVTPSYEGSEPNPALSSDELEAEMEDDSAEDLGTAATSLGSMLTHRVLSRAEERENLIRYVEGDRSAGMAILSHNFRFIWRIAGKWAKHGGHYDEELHMELFQEGVTGAMVALDKYDISRGYHRFISYAKSWIEQKIQRAHPFVDIASTPRIPHWAIEFRSQIVRIQSHIVDMKGTCSLADLMEELDLDTSDPHVVAKFRKKVESVFPQGTSMDQLLDETDRKSADHSGHVSYEVWQKGDFEGMVDEGEITVILEMLMVRRKALDVLTFLLQNGLNSSRQSFKAREVGSYMHTTGAKASLRTSKIRRDIRGMGELFEAIGGESVAFLHPELVLRQLPKGQRPVYKACILKGKSIVDTAKKLGCRPSVVIKKLRGISGNAPKIRERWRELPSIEVVDRLPQRQREAYILNAFEGYRRYEELAQKMDSTVPNVRGRLLDAKKNIPRIEAQLANLPGEDILERLSADQREAYELVMIQGYTYDAAGEEMERSARSVCSLVNEAMKRIEHIRSADQFDHPDERVIVQLPPKVQAVFRMCVVQGLSQTEVQRRTGILQRNMPRIIRRAYELLPEARRVAATIPPDAELEAKLSLLSERQRQVYEGVRLHGRSRVELGRELGISESAVRITLNRAVVRMHGVPHGNKKGQSPIVAKEEGVPDVLTDRERYIYEQVRWAGRTRRDVAAELGISGSLVETALNSADRKVLENIAANALAA